MELTYKKRELILEKLTSISIKIQTLQLGENHKNHFKDKREKAYRNLIETISDIVNIL